jgi:hypothetical protein
MQPAMVIGDHEGRAVGAVSLPAPLERVLSRSRRVSE